MAFWPSMRCPTPAGCQQEDGSSSTPGAKPNDFEGLIQRFDRRFDKIERVLAVVVDQLKANSTEYHAASSGPQSVHGDLDRTTFMDAPTQALITDTLERFADNSARLDAGRLGQALKELGAFGKGSVTTSDDVSKLITSSPGGGGASASLDVRDCVALIHSGVANGNILLPDENDAIQATEAQDDDPWATVLRGDAQLRSMVTEMRNAAASRPATRRGAVSGRATMAAARPSAFDSGRSALCCSSSNSERVNPFVLHPDGYALAL